MDLNTFPDRILCVAVIKIITVMQRYRSHRYSLPRLKTRNSKLQLKLMLIIVIENSFADKCDLAQSVLFQYVHLYFCIYMMAFELNKLVNCILFSYVHSILLYAIIPVLFLLH